MLIFACLGSFAQQEEFHLQGQVVDANKNPVGDALIFNKRGTRRYVSGENGIFDVWVQPHDSVIITHISFIRKVVTVHQLMVNPIVQLDLDTINIRPVNVSASQRSDYERAMKNIERIGFDFRPQLHDQFTDSERMQNLLKTENRVESTASHSVNFLQFSPSEEVRKLLDKHKKRKQAKQFSSTKKAGHEK